MKYLKRLLPLVALVFCIVMPLSLAAQSVTWTVRDVSDWKPLGGVLIQVVDADTLTIGKTNAEGRFSLVTQANPGQRLLFSLSGYQAQWVAWEGGAETNVQVLLEPRLYSFEEIVFTANKFGENKDDLPFQISVIKQADVVINNPSSSANLLEQAGVFVQRSQAGGGSPVLRGFEANRVLLVVDGVRMNNAIYRSGHLQNVLTIDPDLLERSEVMFGPASVMYGSEALGGVMHFYTRNPRLSSNDKLKVDLNAYARVGSAQGERSLHYDMNVGGKRWGVLSSITWRSFGDLRVGDRRPADYPDFGKRDSFVTRINGVDQILANDDPNVMTPNAYEQLDLLQKWYFIQNDHLSHTLNLQYSTSSDIPRFDRLTQTRNGRLRYAEWYYGPQERLMISHRLLHTPASGIYDQLAVVTAYQDIGESRHTRSYQNPWLDHREESVSVASINLDARKEIAGKHELAYGAELFWNGVQSSAYSENIETQQTSPLDTRYPDGGTKVWSAAAYLTHRWEISPRWTLTDGLRYTHYSLQSTFIDQSFFPFPESEISQINQALSGNLGLVHRMSNDWRFSALFSTGFRAPNLDDIAKVFDSQPGNVVVPNPGLKPEYTYNTELSVGKKWGKMLQMELTGWYTLYRDAIVVRDFSVNDRDSILYDGVLSKVQANVNASEALIYGFTHSTQAQWEGLQFRHSITWTYGQELSDDVPLDHIPPLFGQGEIRYRMGRWQLMTRVAYQGWKRLDRYSPREEGDAEFATPEGWAAWGRWDVGGTYTVNEYLRLQLGVDNVLDQHYRTFSSRISAPGRNIWITARMSL